MLQMLGLGKYSNAFEAEGFETVASVISNEELACSILKTRHEKDVLRGYLRVRETQAPDTADLTERRAVAFQLVRETLNKLSVLQARKAALSREDAKDGISDLLDAIDDAKQNLRLGQQQLETLSKESIAAASQQVKSSQLRRPSTIKKTPSVDERLKSPRMANEARPPSECRSRCKPTPLQSNAPVRIDPMNWNRNPTQSRVDRLSKAFRPKGQPSLDPNGLVVFGSKANQVSLGMEIPRDSNAQMCCGATRPPVK